MTAQHNNADSIIHFGPSCLSPTQRLPVLYVFGQQPLDVTTCSDACRYLVEDANKLVLVIYDVVFHHVKGQT